ncbi:tetratricopeptide repeat protein [Actinomadura roseirufa]|uniref:tetratricopeptide repeat protein n=1 Tax=Actinomadura roseirufa TaxID=2094049 RepID=UPI001041B92F|nr:tetratricopeptide repeat protein [Actinomadura roseirufa]
MDIGRVVEVAGRAGGEWEIGTGYLVGGPLILAAGHTLPDGLTEVKVRLPEGRWRDAAAAWRGSGDLDAALVTLGDTWKGPGPQPFGRITGSSKSVRCTAMGFPAALSDRLEEQESFQLDGKIRPGSGRRRREHHITLADHPGDLVRRRGARRTRWSGYSGAAVFCGDRLTGVVVADLDEAGGLRLIALPMERLLADAGFRTALGHVPDLCSVELHPSYPRRARAPRAPSEWLRPETEVTGFRGRDALLDELAGGWCGSAAPQSVLLVTGSAGQGKTRLAGELCRRMREAGWEAGRLAEIGKGLGKTVADTAVPLLLVVDYAETRTGELGRFLARVARRDHGPPVRVLLLARTAGEWWEQFRAASAETEDLLADCAVHRLEPLAPGAELRAEEFAVARAEFAAALSVKPPAEPAPDLSGAETVLAVHVAALTSVLQSGAAAMPALEGERPETVLLKHEEHYWRRAAAAAGLHAEDGGGLRLRTLSRLVAAAALCGAGDFADAERLIKALRETADLPVERRDAVAEWLRGLYPADASYWGPLQPDRLGEHLVAIESARPAPFLEHLVDELLAADGVAQVVQALQVAARASVHDDAMGERLSGLVATRPSGLALHAARLAPALERPEPLVAALRRIVADPATPDGVLSALIEETSPLSHVLSGVLFDLATRAIAVHNADPESDPDDLTALLMIRAGAQMRQGDFGGTLAAFAELRRRAGTLDTSVIGDWTFALSLVDEADVLLMSGAAERAREAIEAAWQLIWKRFDEDDEDDWAILAHTLRAHAHCLWILDENEDAAFLAAEAVTLSRKILADGPAEAWASLLSVSLADALKTLCGARSDLGDLAGALAAHNEALEVIEPLAADRPDIFGTALAPALVVGAMILDKLDRRPEALDRIERAIAVLRRLSRSTPSLYQTQMVYALSQKARLLALLGHPDRADAVAAEAFAVTGGAADDERAAIYLAVIAEAVDQLRAEGAARLAVTFGREAVRRRLAGADAVPAGELPGLLRSALSLAGALSSVGEAEEAGRVFGDCLRWYRGAESAATPVAELLRLRDLGLDLGRWADTRALCTEAVLRFNGRPGQDSNLAYALRALFRVVNALGEHDAALEVVTAAIGVRARLPDADPADLGELHTARADTLLYLGRPPEERLPDVERALALFRTADPPDPMIACALVALGACMAELGRRPELLDAAEEAIAVARDVPSQRPAYSFALYQRVYALAMLGRYEEAERYLREILDHYRDDPSAENPRQFASALMMLATIVDDRGGDAQEVRDLAGAALAVTPRLPEGERNLNTLNAHHRMAGASRRLGDLEEEIGHLSAVVALRREAPALLGDLADDLTKVAATANALGRFTEAADAAREAGDLLRAAAPGWPRLQALNELQLAMLGLGRVRESAVTLAENADLAGSIGEAARGTRASCLVTLACQRWRLGEREAAAEAAVEAVRALVRPGELPDGLPTLGRALALEAVTTGRPVTADEVEAGLLAAAPEAGPADLAAGLAAFAAFHVLAGSVAVSHAANGRAIALLRPVAAADPARGAALAEMLQFHAWAGQALGLAVNPLELTAEARALTEPADPSAAPPSAYAMAVFSEANGRFWLGRPDLAWARRTIEVTGGLPPETYGRRDWLANAWAMTAMCHVLLGDGAAGAEAAARSLELLPGEWSVADPSEAIRASAMTAKARSEFLLGEDAAALATLEDAVALHRVSGGPTGHLGTAGLAFALTTRAEALARSGWEEAAQEAAEEAVPLWDRVRAAGLRAMEGLPERARVLAKDAFG